MGSDTAYSPSPPRTLAIPAENHRKRRRNRTRVSCLNCYASKRKCDRKRPCTRCIKHGLTGLCFYELDDPAVRDDCTMDETTHLRRRIAELESVVRAMNNRPHPRWTAPGGVTHRTQTQPPPRRSNRTRRGPRAPSSVDAFFDAEAEVAAAADATEESEVNVKLEPDTDSPVFTPSDSEGESVSPAAAQGVTDECLDSPFDSPLTPLLPDLFMSSDELYRDPNHSRNHVECNTHASTSSSQEEPPRTEEEERVEAHSTHTSTGMQTSPRLSLSPSPMPELCDCLAAATLHSPLVYFASALRASREGLEGSHSPDSPCMLLRRIRELDDHIFSVAPPDPAPGLHLMGEESLCFEGPTVAHAPLTTSSLSPAPTTLHLTPYNHAESTALAFLETSMQPSLWEWT